MLLAAALAGVAARVVAAELEQSVTAPPPASSPGSGVVTFEMEVQPLLTRFGCNSGACHDKSRGQNGFALSLLGFDGNFDYDELAIRIVRRGVTPATVGPIQFEVAGLPPGVTVPTVISEPTGTSATEVKLVFTAAGPAFSGPMRIVGKATQPQRLEHGV